MIWQQKGSQKKKILLVSDMHGEHIELISAYAEEMKACRSFYKPFRKTSSPSKNSVYEMKRR